MGSTGSVHYLNMKECNWRPGEQTLQIPKVYVVLGNLYKSQHSKAYIVPTLSLTISIITILKMNYMYL